MWDIRYCKLSKKQKKTFSPKLCLVSQESKTFKNMGNKRYCDLQEAIKNKTATICTKDNFVFTLAHVGMNFNEFDSDQNNAIHQHQETTIAQKQNYKNCAFPINKSECPDRKQSLLTKISVCFVKCSCRMNPDIVYAKHHENFKRCISWIPNFHWAI